MRPVRAVAILLLAFLLAAAPADDQKKSDPVSETLSQYMDVGAEDVFASRIEAIQKDIAKDMAELPKVFERFVALQEKYKGTENLADLGPKRKELRDKLVAGSKRLNDGAREFHTIRKDYQFQQGVILFSKMVAGENEDSVWENFETIHNLGNYDKGAVLNLKDEIIAALEADNVLFNRIVQRRKRKRELRLYVGIGAALLLILMGAIFYWSRVKAASRPSPGAPLPGPAARLKAPPGPASVGRFPTASGGGTSSGEASVVGSILGGRFKVEKLLRTGTLGPVYEALDTGDGSKVILKAVLEDFHRTTGDLERFFEKTKVLAGFRHRNLAEVREVFREDSRIYIASQRVSGMPLAKFISPGNLIELRSIKLIASQIAILVDAAHEKKLIHGDLGPSNIIVQEDGAVKVLDFGIGIEARKMSAKLSLGRRIGDPAYLAPEQELGSDFQQSDIFSLGILCFAMLTGRIPFEGPNYLAQKRERRYAPASSLSEKIPVEIDPVLHKALEPEPAHRYQKGVDFFDALDAVPEKIG